MYTIGQVAEMFHLPISTLRYYDKEGLFPNMERVSGIRQFNKKERDALRIIECLKKSGLSIKDIKSYIDMSLKGDETIDERLELFKRQREKVINQMKELQNTLDTLEYKCWFYETAQKAGTTSVLKDISIDEIPENLRKTKEKLDRMHRR